MTNDSGRPNNPPKQPDQSGQSAPTRTVPPFPPRRSHIKPGNSTNPEAEAATNASRPTNISLPNSGVKPAFPVVNPIGAKPVSPKPDSVPPMRIAGPNVPGQSTANSGAPGARPSHTVKVNPVPVTRPVKNLPGSAVGNPAANRIVGESPQAGTASPAVKTQRTSIMTGRKTAGAVPAAGSSAPIIAAGSSAPIVGNTPTVQPAQLGTQQPGVLPTAVLTAPRSRAVPTSALSVDTKPGKQVKWEDMSKTEAELEAAGVLAGEEAEVWAGRAPKKKIPNYRRPYRFDLLSWIGEILITLGVLGGLLAFWDVYVTDWQVKDFNNAAIKQFKQGKTCKASVSKDIHKEPPPAVTKVGLGEPLAILHYPSWNYMTVPVREGADQYIIDTGAAGHYAETAMPGEIGNFSVAAHRRSYGSNFRRVDTLKEGDPVIVETSDTWIVYKVYNKQIVDPSQGEVIAPVPGKPGQQPTERLMTMTTCHPEYGNWQRYIVHLKYDHWIPKSSGVPEELAAGGNACTN